MPSSSGIRERKLDGGGISCFSPISGPISARSRSQWEIILFSWRTQTDVVPPFLIRQAELESRCPQSPVVAACCTTTTFHTRLHALGESSSVQDGTHIAPVACGNGPEMPLACAPAYGYPPASPMARRLVEREASPCPRASRHDAFPACRLLRQLCLRGVAEHERRKSRRPSYPAKVC